MATEGRIAALDYLRLLAASAVMFSHSFVLTGAPQRDLLERTTGQLDFAAVAVDFFFFVSGFLMFGALRRSNDRRRFIVNRFARISPGLTICVLACVLMGGVVTSLSGTDYLRSLGTWLYLKNAVFVFTAPLPGVFEHHPYPSVVNGSLWTLFYEMACYACVVVVAGWPSHRRVGAFLLAAIACLIGLMLRTGHEPTLAGNVFRLLFFFGLGHVFGDRRGRFVVAGLLLAALLGCLFVAPMLSARIEWHLLSAAFCASILFGASLVNRWVKPLPSDYSFGIYIYGFAVQQCLVGWMPDFPPAGFFAVSLLVVTPLAALSWNVVERPAMKWLHAWQARSRGGSDAAPT